MEIKDKKRFVITNQDISNNAETYLWKIPLDGTYEVIFQKTDSTKIPKKRTITQNACLHKYLSIIAGELAESGQDMRTIINLPIKPTMENVKDLMFKPVMHALYPDKTSTTQLSTVEMQECYEVFNAAIGERLGVSCGWPSRDML